MYSTPLMGGDDGTVQTVVMIRRVVDDAWKDPVVNRAAIEIIRGAGAQPYDSWAQIQAVYNFAKTFYFVNDPVMKEALRPTRELLQLMAGDCDDINAILLPSLLGTIGYETRIVTIACEPEVPEAFTHVYCEVFVDGQWYPLDAARPGATFGVAPEHFYRREWWSLTDDSHGDYPCDAPASAMAGLGRVGVRGLAGVMTSLYQTPSGEPLQSISGQAVQPVLGPCIGPGGAGYVTPAAQAPGPGVGTQLLFFAGVGLLLWGLSR
jgi:hypothetical protein